MLQVTSRSQLHEQLERLRKSGAAIGLVPTMGNLHSGHTSLVTLIREHCDVCVVSIFVNPTQFGVGEDLESYPRTPEEDLAALQQAGCDLVFSPEVSAIYPDGAQAATVIRVPVVSEGLCGGTRPGHFDGVATVVSVLFSLVRPDVAVFGKKDFQQLKVIEKLVRDLGMPIRILGASIVREDSGLAMSSRNQYLTASEAAEAPALHRVLVELATQIKIEQVPLDRALELAVNKLADAGLAVDYLEVRNAADLSIPGPEDKALVALIAARLGAARLIDNIEFSRLPE